MQAEHLDESAEVARLAGIFWGEGCVRISRQRPYQLIVLLGNSDYEMVELFNARWPGGIGNWVAYTGTPMRNWSISGVRACDFCDLIAPFVGGVKRVQVEIGRRYRPLLGVNGRHLPNDILDARRALLEEMKAITDPYGTRTGGRKRKAA